MRAFLGWLAVALPVALAAVLAVAGLLCLFPALAAAQSLEDGVTGGYSPVAARYQWGSTGGDWPAPVAPTIDCRLSQWTSGNLDCGGAVFTPSGSPTAGVPTYWRPGGVVAGLGVGFDGVDDVLKGGVAGHCDGDQFVCVRFMASTVVGVAHLISRWGTGATEFALYRNGSTLSFAIGKAGGSASTLVFTTGLAAGVEYTACAAYDYAADGTSIMRGNVAGVVPTEITNAVGPPTTGADLNIGGANNAATFSGTISGAIRGCYAPSAADLARMVRSQYAAQGSLGEPLTVTGPATSAVLVKADGAPFVATAPANMPSIVAEGLQVYGAYTQALPYSETLGSWTLANITPSATTGPNGAATATVLTATASGVQATAGRGFTATALQWTCHGWIRAGTVSAARISLIQGSPAVVTPRVLEGPGEITGDTYPTVTGLSQTGWTHVSLTTNSALTAAAATVYLFVRTTLATSILEGDSVHATMWNCHAGATVLPYAATAAAPLSVAATSLSAAHGIADPNRSCVPISFTPSAGAWNTGTATAGLWHIGAAGSYGTLNTMSLTHFTTGAVRLTVFDAAAASRYVETAALSAGAHRITACNGAGALSIHVDGALASGAAGGVGTGIVAAANAAIQIGSLGGSSYESGSISAITTCNTSIAAECQ